MLFQRAAVLRSVLLGGSKRRRLKPCCHTVCPFCSEPTFLCLGGWEVDAPPPLSLTTPSIYKLTFVRSCQTASKQSKTHFCAGVIILFWRFLCHRWSKLICAVAFGVVSRSWRLSLISVQHAECNLFVRSIMWFLFFLFLFFALKCLSTLFKWRCMLMERFKEPFQ